MAGDQVGDRIDGDGMRHRTDALRIAAQDGEVGVAVQPGLQAEQRLPDPQLEFRAEQTEVLPLDTAGKGDEILRRNLVR